MLPREIGDQFEEDLAGEFGLDRVSGSGNQWHSKLDLKGFGGRWSLKATKWSSISLKLEDIDEMIEKTEGLGGTGEIPIMAIRLNALDVPEDLVLMRKRDFAALARGEYTLIRESKVEAGRRYARTPQLLREEGDG